MKKNKKKLPRFYLGTRLGYQPNYGIGNYQFSSNPGESVEPETNAIKRNIVPSALNKLQSSSSFAMNALGNIVTAPAAATVIKPAASQAVYAPAPYGLGGRFSEETLNTLYSAGGEEMLKTAGGEGAKAGARTTLSTLGTALAGVGTVYGGIDMGMQIASNKDHRTAADMRNTLTTNTYTTDYGNTYTTHTGLDRSAELDYARKQRLAKNLNFTASSIGTGMSAGALVGSLAGSSISPGLGTAIGAGVGALGGGLAYLLGFGDTEDETNAAMDRLTDVTAMGDRMSYSLAKDKDSKQGFYSKTRPDGSMGAANGKRPFKARVSNGEVVGNFEEGWASQVPGKPNNKDSKITWLRPSDFVISNKFGLSDYAKATGDYAGALNMQDILMRQYKNRAKNGKLPKYEDGIVPLIIAASVPRIAGLASNWQLANELKKADTSTPVEYISDYGANTVPYQMMSNLPDARIYLNRSDRNYKNYLYNIKRNPGLGPGGKAITMANAYIQKLAQDAETLSNIDTIRRLQINDALKLRFTEAQRMSGLKHDSWWKRREDRNRIISKFNDLRAAIPVNMYTIGSDLGTSISNIYQKKEALDQQAKLNAIFESKGDVDAIKAYTSLFNMLNNKPK